MAERIQLKRTPGWRMPPGAVKVDRTTDWGNPFKTGEPIERDSDLWPFAARLVPGGTEGFASITLLRAEDVVSAYSWWIIEQPGLMLRMEAELGGKNLGCWCRLPRAGEPDHCHARNLMELVAELEGVI